MITYIYQEGGSTYQSINAPSKGDHKKIAAGDLNVLKVLNGTVYTMQVEGDSVSVAKVGDYTAGLTSEMRRDGYRMFGEIAHDADFTYEGKQYQKLGGVSPYAAKEVQGACELVSMHPHNIVKLGHN